MTQLSTGANLSDTVPTATVPAGFEVIPLPARGVAIPDLICLDLAVRHMSHLADLSWEALVEPEAKSVDGVTIETSSTGASRGTRGIQVRYIIWGIYRAIQDLMGGRTGTIWLEIAYELKWQGQVVGLLWIRKSNPSNEENRNPSDQLGQDHLVNSPPASDGTVSAILPPNNNPTISADPELEILIFYPPVFPDPPLGDYSVCINMLALIVFGSQNPSTGRIGRTHGLSVTGYNAQIAVTGPADTRKPMSRPPYFRWHDMFRAVRVASAEMRQRRYYSKLRVKLQVEGVEIGNIRIDPRGAFLTTDE
ncbi:MAG: hypothetical protein LQ346_001758 [Caloplaca aetnensis]|nr:MAG: hypothetical protein LQ346_001758 [Caloplaca aetnensis]